MARTWLSVKVELLGGRGEDLWPWPGRIFAVGPSHTLLDLVDAINQACARWDLSHLSLFTLEDGRMVTDEETGAEMVASPFGPLTVALDLEVAKVARTVKPGAQFQYTFDLGDEWIHRCTVGVAKIDPFEVVGFAPRVPLPYWGWGSIPDQYGRRWVDDDGEGPVPSRPRTPDPMLLHTWPALEQVPTVDVRALRESMAAQDSARFLAAVLGYDIDDALQLVGAGMCMVLKRRRQDAEDVALSALNRLTSRCGPGDQVRSDELLAVLRRESPAGRVVSVDLDRLSAEREGDLEVSIGGYIDLRTGDIYDDSATDPATAGEDAAIDVDEEPDRWLRFVRTGSRDRCQDMSDFAQKQRDESLRARMEHAIQGEDAFRRFRDLVHDEGLAGQWEAYAADRRWGRARAFLADEGIRVG